MIKRILFCAILCFSSNLFAAEKITLMLDWFMNPDHAPIFVAQHQGFFKAQGLEVQIISPADPADPPKLVAANKADLAITYQPTLMLAVDQGLPLMRVATLVATPLNCLIVLNDSHIQNINDLKGKRIGYSMGGTDHMMLAAFLQSAGLSFKDVTLVNVHYDLTQALMAHKVDAITSVMRNFEFFELALMNQPATMFYPEEYGMPSYDELIIVANKNKAHDPKIQKFIIALNQGVQYLINHPESTWQAFAKTYPELNNPLNHNAWQASLRRFSLTPAALDESRYNNFATFMKNNGTIHEVPPVKEYAISVPY